jgi:tight adherence protein B
MPAPVLLGVAACSLGVLLAVFTVLAPGPARLPLSRLDPAVAEPATRLADAAGGTTAAIERFLGRHSLTGALTRRLDAAGVRRRPAEFVLIVTATALAVTAAGLLLGGALLAVLLAPATPAAAAVILRVLGSRRRAAFADQLDESLQLMASSLRAGHSLLRAMDAVAQEAEAPTSEEFARLVNETRVGRDLTGALEELAARVGSQDFVWVTQAIAIHREVGGNLAEVLDQVGHTIRERNQIRRQVKALSAEGKLSAYVLMGLPIGITGFLALTNPSYIGKLTASPMGWAMLGAAVVMLTLGGLWLRKTVSFRF